jgi:hypothetical protein
VQEFAVGLKAVIAAREGVLVTTTFSSIYYGLTTITALASKAEDHEVFHDQVTSDIESTYDRPHAFLVQPIFREIYNDTSEMVGTINALITWDRYFTNLLPEGVQGITCVASNTCGQSFTYYLDGNKVSCARV